MSWFSIIDIYFWWQSRKGPRPVHGHTATIKHDGKGMFEGLPESFEVARYHSLIADKHHIPEGFTVSAWLEEGIPMAIRHQHLPIEAVQYHPEAILSEYGLEQIANF